MPGSHRTFARPPPGHQGLASLAHGLLALLLILLATTAHGQAAPEPVLRVGVYHNPPKIQLNSQGWPSGILGDLLLEIGREQGWRIQAVPCEWQACLTALANGEIDLLPDVALTPERAQTLRFHQVPALHSWSQVYRNAGIAISSIHDLAHRRISVLGGSVQETELATMLAQFGISATLVAAATYDDAFAMAASGNTDAAVSNRHFGDLHAQAYGLLPTPVVFNPAQLYYAASPQVPPQVHAALDSTLRRWLDDPHSYYYQVLRHWSPALVPTVWPRWLLAVLLATVAAALLSLGLAAWLKRQVGRRTQELRTSEARLNTILDSVDAAIFIKDRDLRYQYANQSVSRVLGRPLDQILGHTDADWFEPGTVANLERNDRRVLDTGQRVVSEEEDRLQDQTEPRVYLSVKLPLRQPDGQIYALCGISTDITEQRRLISEIQLLSRYDALTRLPNRSQLLARLQHCLDSLASRPHTGALLIINIDHMRALNESRGQHTGDLLLQQAAQRLAGNAGQADMVARLGGDEFGLIVPDLDATPSEAGTKASTLARHLLQTLSRPYDLAGLTLDGTASIGIALFSNPRDTIDDVLRHADVALSQAKAAGRNTSSLFHPDMSAVLAARAGLEADLRTALEQRQFVLYYQPQVDDRGETLGFEALIRWEHPRRGLLLPTHFIPLAETSGLILPLGDWVLRSACDQLANWAQYPATRHLTLAVNISPAQLRSADFVDRVLQLLAQSGARPGQLEIELTEGHLLEDFESGIAKLRQLRSMGVRIALDDFGTGYSSLNYLKQLPLDQIKIDMSFVRDLVHDPNDVTIVRTIISLGKSLGLQVLAEGVESDAQHLILRELGCSRFQGYWFGRPQPWPTAS